MFSSGAAFVAFCLFIPAIIGFAVLCWREGNKRNRRD